MLKKWKPQKQRIKLAARPVLGTMVEYQKLRKVWDAEKDKMNFTYNDGN